MELASLSGTYNRENLSRRLFSTTIVNVFRLDYKTIAVSYMREIFANDSSWRQSIRLEKKSKPNSPRAENLFRNCEQLTEPGENFTRPNSMNIMCSFPVSRTRTARPGQLLVDCSTVDPLTSRTIAEMAADRNVEFVDAPVSGGECNH